MIVYKIGRGDIEEVEEEIEDHDIFYEHSITPDTLTEDYMDKENYRKDFRIEMVLNYNSFLNIYGTYLDFKNILNKYKIEVILKEFYDSFVVEDFGVHEFDCFGETSGLYSMYFHKQFKNIMVNKSNDIYGPYDDCDKNREYLESTYKKTVEDLKILINNRKGV